MSVAMTITGFVLSAVFTLYGTAFAVWTANREWGILAGAAVSVIVILPLLVAQMLYSVNLARMSGGGRAWRLAALVAIPMAVLRISDSRLAMCAIGWAPAWALIRWGMWMPSVLLGGAFGLMAVCVRVQARFLFRAT